MLMSQKHFVLSNKCYVSIFFGNILSLSENDALHHKLKHRHLAHVAATSHSLDIPKVLKFESYHHVVRQSYYAGLKLEATY